MTALRRMSFRSFGGLAALMALALGSPAPAQNSDAPIDVTAAPPPSAETVGPSQLRDFNLQGTVTRPSEGPAAAPNQPATATTAPAAPRPNEAVPSEAAAPAIGTRNIPVSTPPTLTPSSPPRAGASQPNSQADPVTPSQPLDVNIGTAAQPGFSDGDSPGELAIDAPGSAISWPWIAALIAVLAGVAFLGWTRHNRRLRYGDAGRMAFAGAQADAGSAPLASPPVRPRADPVPRRGQSPAPRPDPLPRPASPAPPKPSDDGLVVSTRFKPELNVSFVPDRVVITPTDAVLQFDIVIANSGSAPARDVLVEAKMFTAHPGQDQEIASFFHRPVATGDRIPGIAPLAKLALKSMVKIPLEELRSFEAAGRQLFVPLVGFNVLFRSSGGEGQASASFLVGRGNETDEKLAPFRLDLGPRIFRGLSARPHSLGLQPA